jgi:hypothetical protein
MERIGRAAAAGNDTGGNDSLELNNAENELIDPTPDIFALVGDAWRAIAALLRVLHCTDRVCVCADGGL